MKIVDLFADLDEVAVNLDQDTMTGIDLVFRTRSRSHIYTVNLYTGEKRGGGKLEYNSLSDDGKKLSMEPVEFKAKDIEDGKADLGQALLRAIEEKVAEDSD